MARDFYHDLPPRDTRQWLYFDKFKMTLHHQKQLSRSTLITASNGIDSLPAITVFAHALRFFKEQALRELSEQTAIPIHSNLFYARFVLFVKNPKRTATEIVCWNFCLKYFR